MLVWPMKNRILHLILLFQVLSFSCFGVGENRDASFGSCLELAKSLQESGDHVSSLIIFNMIIENKEKEHQFDAIYLDSIRGAISEYSSFHPPMVLKLFDKLKEHDKNLFSNMKFQDGCLIMKDLPSEMTDPKKRGWVKEIFSIFGMDIADSDIKFDNDTISIKLPERCCCKPPNIACPNK